MARSGTEVIPPPGSKRALGGVLSYAGAQLLTGLETGILAAAAHLTLGIPLGAALVSAFLVGLPLMVVQAWALYRVGPLVLRLGRDLPGLLRALSRPVPSPVHPWALAGMTAGALATAPFAGLLTLLGG